MPAIPVRLVLLAAAAVAIAVGAHALRADHGCRDARADARSADVTTLAAVAREALRQCGDPADRAVVAVVLLNRGSRVAAVDVVRGMTASTPDSYVGWLALWRLTGDRAALATAHRLNPRGTPAP